MRCAMFLSLTVAFLLGQPAPKTQWEIDKVQRDAVVFTPTKKSDAAVPLVFVFHGHGGTSPQAARKFRVHELWPEALVVYPQGLPTPGQLTDPEGKKSGWQRTPGDQGDRDLKLFDTILKDLRGKHKID